MVGVHDRVVAKGGAWLSATGASVAAAGRLMVVRFSTVTLAAVSVALMAAMNNAPGGATN